MLAVKRFDLTFLILALAALFVVAAGGYWVATWAQTAPVTSASSADMNMSHGAGTLAPAAAVQKPNVVRNPTDIPGPLNRTTPATVDVTLTIQEVTAEIADGATYSFWTFDGTVPGPMIRVMEGDTVRLTLTNPATNKMSHNIDLHAVTGPGGGAAVTGVAPGESKTLTFKALHAGAYIYHCAFTPAYAHISQGMYGGIVVEPPGGLPRVDREFYVVQGEWYTSGTANDKGNQTFDGAKAMAEKPEYFTFNGHMNALTKIAPLHAEKGETVRLFFGDGGPNVAANFHVIGETFDKVYAGAPQTYVANEETVVVPPGSMSIFEFKLDLPGQYLLVDHALWRIAKGAAGMLMVGGEWDNSLYSPNASTATH